MMVAKPILHVGSFRNKEVLEAGAGYVIPSNDVKEIAQVIMKTYGMNEDERVAIGNSGRHWVVPHISG